MEILNDIGFGLIILAAGLGVLDFVFVNTLKKMYPNPDYWSDQNYKMLDPDDQKHWQFRKKTYESGVSHRFLKVAGMLMLIGIVFLIVSRMLPHFT
jgi:hypothetical protein